MTDVDLQKKADLYANNTHFTEYDNPSLSESLDISEEIKQAYLAGAKENGVVWHILEEDPDDLPVGEVFYYFDQNPALKDRKVYGRSIGYYNSYNKEWYGYYQGCPCRINNVIAWCEIPSWREVSK